MENEMEEVSNFVVVAPSDKRAEYASAADRLIGHLAIRFPHYSFRVESFGPLSDPDDFTVIPIVNRLPRPEERDGDPDRLYLCKPLDPRVIPQIRDALREFRIEALGAN